MILGEGVTLRRNLETLVEVFGPAVQKSCIVMLTKEPFNPARAEYIQNICAQLSPKVKSYRAIIHGKHSYFPVVLSRAAFSN